MKYAREDFIVPDEPRRSTTLPGGIPPPRTSRSNPRTNVFTDSTDTASTSRRHRAGRPEPPLVDEEGHVPRLVAGPPHLHDPDPPRDLEGRRERVDPVLPRAGDGGPEVPAVEEHQEASRVLEGEAEGAGLDLEALATLLEGDVEGGPPLRRGVVRGDREAEGGLQRP